MTLIYNSYYILSCFEIEEIKSFSSFDISKKKQHNFNLFKKKTVQHNISKEIILKELSISLKLKDKHINVFIGKNWFNF